MSAHSSPADRRRDPWIDHFLASPADQFADLLAGYVQLPNYEQADAREIARLVFVPLDPSDRALEVLDRTVKTWLEARRQAGVPQGEIEEVSRTLRQICDALRFVSLIRLPKSAVDLRTRFPLWKSWVDRLSDLEPDVRAEFHNCLAMTQRLVGEVRASSDKFALEAMWLALCGQAGSSYPDSYLSIGLLGLRQLPDRKGALSVHPWMLGLGLWAAAQRPSVEQFSARWQSLKALYPLTPRTWRRALKAILDDRRMKGLDGAVLAAWQHDVALVPEIARQPREKKIASLEVINDILKRASQPLAKIASEVLEVLDERERNCQATGDSFFLVRTVNNFGMTLLRRSPPNELKKRGEFCSQLARLALGWEPNNLFSWSLWRDSYAAQGQLETAELIAWESVHRFPEDDQKRNQLALLMSHSPAKLDDAEALLRETMSRFPNDSVCRNQLAQLLMRHPRGRGRAEALLRETIKTDPRNDRAWSELGRLLSQESGRAADAVNLLREARRAFPNDPVFSNQLAILLARNPATRAEAESILRQVIALPDSDVVSKRSLAYILSNEPKSYSEAKELLRQVLNNTPGDQFARQLLDQITQRESVKLGGKAAAPPPAAEEPGGENHYEKLLRTFLSDAIKRAPSIRVEKPPRAVTAVDTAPSKASHDVAALVEGGTGNPPAAPPEDQAAGPPDSAEPADELELPDEPLDIPADGDGEIKTPPPEPPQFRVPAKQESIPAADKRAARAAEDDYADAFLETTLRGGRLRRIQFELNLTYKSNDENWRKEAIRQVQAACHSNDNDLYSKYLKDLLSGQLTATTAAGDWSMIFAQAVYRKDRTQLAALSPKLDFAPLLDMAKTHFLKDERAGERFVRWRDSPALGDSRPVAALRNFFELRFTTGGNGLPRRVSWGSIREFVELVAANDNVAIDLMEAAFAA